MYCPNCSTHGVEGAKFCKACGMNLTVVTQALSGGVVVAGPMRDREYKRARKQISDGIHGAAIGAALLVGGGLAYFLVPSNAYVMAPALGLAIFGVIKLFRAAGGIIDAKVGQKLVSPALHPRGTGNLSASAPMTTALSDVRGSQRISDPVKAASSTQASVGDASPVAPASPMALPPPIGGRVNREHSTPLKNLERDSEIFSDLRN